MIRILARLLAAILFLTLAVDAGAAEAATRPSAPRAVKATPLNQAVKVTWVRPATSGGASIDRYVVQRRSSTTASWVTVKRTSASARTWTNTGLVNGRRYYFRVLAHNARGNSVPSLTASAVPRTVPLSPRALSADTYLLGFGAYWYAPTGNGGAPIDFYLVEISLDGATWTTPKKSTTARTSAAPLMFTGLKQGDRYWLRVRAHNAAGYSVSTGAGPYRAYTTAGAVEDLAAVPGSSSGQVDLEWTAPRYSGDGIDPEVPAGVPQATSYKIEQSQDGENWTVVAPKVTTTAYTVSGLANATSYQFRVSAASLTRLDHGPTQQTQAVTPVGAPTAPLNLTLGWRLDEGNVLAWDPPANDGGIDVTRYVIQRWTQSTLDPRPTFQVDGDVLQASPSDFALDHEFRVKACNGPDEIEDCSPWSDPIGPIPGGVQNANATDTTDGTTASVTLAWDLPMGAAPIDYTVSRSTDDGATWTAFESTTELGYVDTTAEYGTTYKYRIVANGANGSGTWVFAQATTDHLLSTSTTAVQVTEGGNNTFQVTLSPVVQNDTVITVTSNSSAAAPTSSTVTIPAGQSSANVTIDGLSDSNLANETVTITLGYGTQTKQVTVNVTDNDTQALVLTDDPVTLTEGGSQIVEVSLAYQPAGNVTVNVGTNAPGTATVSGSLTFTTSNWNVPQPVTITGQSPGSATVSVSAAGATTRTIDVTVEAP